MGAHSLVISELLAGYRARRVTPTQVIDTVLRRIEQAPEKNVWITRLTREQVFHYVRMLESRSPESAPLYGIPFAIKDNIDLANIATTAACKAFARTPIDSATAVQKLIDAGAIPIGKTNLDQFAAGLVGTRSDIGICRNSFNSDYISGGSSSGSAVAVADGLVSFALGTDTAGSGRVPAAFNNVVGLKPSRGRVSTYGVLPACRSLDCVSIFALTVLDAARVLEVIEGFDEKDEYSNTRIVDAARPTLSRNAFRFGVPLPSQLKFFGDREYPHLFAESIKRLEDLGGYRIDIDFEPFIEAARLLYDGPWIAERYAAIEQFIESHADAMQPITRQIIGPGRDVSAVATFRAQYRLQQLARRCSAVWNDIDVLVTPTAGTIYRVDQVQSEPLKLNTQLGYYTNHVNLLDLAALAVPAGFRTDGLPFGVTLLGPRNSDRNLLALGARLHSGASKVGTLETAPVESIDGVVSATVALEDQTAVVVCGAHMEGLLLNHQLTSRGARLLRRTQTAPVYRLFALPGDAIRRPGLIRVATEGASIAVEVWSIPLTELGSFVAGIPEPLGFGKVLLDDGEQALGFLCETYAMAGATEITTLGGWRAYLAALAGCAGD